jgi:hypothetical protein
MHARPELRRHCNLRVGGRSAGIRPLFGSSDHPRVPSLPRWERRALLPISGHSAATGLARRVLEPKLTRHFREAGPRFERALLSSCASC